MIPVRPLRVLILWLCTTATLHAQALRAPSPEEHLGFVAGADFHLAHWNSVVDYFQKVDQASDRVTVRELGKTSEGRPFLVAIVSAPETVRDLERYRDLQAQLADPRKAPNNGNGVDPVRESKTVVLITCSIHSSETASTLMAMDLLHEMATKDDPATREVLANTILLLVPSVNPDGVEKVAAWYERALGKPWEGGGMPELYHPYAGHDTNRDWFMLNLEETRLLTRLLYHEWWPTLTYDVHQMGPKGARMFVPPFFDPINPNLEAWLNQGIALIGAHMAADLAAAGKKGVLTRAMYDNWWNGGNRTTPQRHNMVGVLTESASVRMASPIFLERSELAGATRGFSDHKPAVNFPDPWPGGWWRLRDIVEYQTICARSLLTLAAKYREAFQANYKALGLKAIERGKAEPPFAWVVPIDQRDPGTATELVRILRETGIDVQRARSEFQALGQTFPAGSFVLPAAQPYRPHLKDMMERQTYPDRFTAGGAAEPPYDVAGWTLPLQMGVRASAIDGPFQVNLEVVAKVDSLKGRVEGAAEPTYYVLKNQANDDVRVLAALLTAGAEVSLATEAGQVGDLEVPSGSLIVKADAKARQAIEKALASASSAVLGAKGEPAFGDKKPVPLKARRIGVYQPWQPSMDEGWTRLVLEKFGVTYTTLHNADVRAGDLRARLDVVLIPSIPNQSLSQGFPPEETEPTYVGGLGFEGAEALRQFVKQGGVLVCLDKSCAYVIDEFDLPIANALSGLKTSEFYCPGSILAATVRPGSLLTTGLPDQVSVYFDKSMAFDFKAKSASGTLAAALTYGTSEVLQSGWLLGPDKIRGKAALVDWPQDQGHIVLFGFPPQHRGQPHGTFRLLFNALLLVGQDGVR
jgi:hypothetical protein